MDAFLINMSYAQLTVICIAVFSFISASGSMNDMWSRRLRDELATVGHMMDVPPPTEQSTVLHGHSGRSCRDVVTQLTHAITQYAECASQYALNSRVCEKCIDYYLNAADLVATDFSVHPQFYIQMLYSELLSDVIIVYSLSLLLI